MPDHRHRPYRAGLLPLIVVLLSCANPSTEGPQQPPQRLEGAPVTLTLNSGEEIPDPTDEQLRSRLAALDVERDGEGFAILARADLTYIQVSGDRRLGFDMEYQDGGTSWHYRARRSDLSLDDVAEAFAAYRDGSSEWWYGKDWEDISW